MKRLITAAIILGLSSTGAIASQDHSEETELTGGAVNHLHTLTFPASQKLNNVDNSTLELSGGAIDHFDKPSAKVTNEDQFSIDG